MLAELILFSENPAVMLADYKTESIIPKGTFQPVLQYKRIAVPIARTHNETAKTAKIRAFSRFQNTPNRNRTDGLLLRRRFCGFLNIPDRRVFCRKYAFFILFAFLKYSV